MLSVVQARLDSSDGLLDEYQLGMITRESVVLPDRNVGGFDLLQIPQHEEMIAQPVGVHSSLRRVLVLAHGCLIAMRSYARRSRLRHMPITNKKWTVPATAIPVSMGPHELLLIHFPAPHTMR